MKSDDRGSPSTSADYEGRLESQIDDLTEFQRDSADHVVRRFYGAASAQRFLIADETGLGKTRVARGVIAKAIDELSLHDDIHRIDIVYVCSNADLAQQNLKRLNVTGSSDTTFNSRLTMLAEHSKRFDESDNLVNGKPVNFVSFTPGTSFDAGLRTGSGQERAMLHIALDQILGLNEQERQAALKFFQVTIERQSTFEQLVEERWRNLGDGIDPAILEEFEKKIDALNEDNPCAPTKQFRAFLARIIDGENVSDFKEEAYRLIGRLRKTLAAASVESLEPDLVILDEFQRFKDLLDPETESGELAHSLFDYNGGSAKVLLLSATPYKPFSFAEEAESHENGLFATLEFLARGCKDADLDRVRHLLAEYRATVQSGHVDALITRELNSQLTRLMTRQERPELRGRQMRIEKKTCANKILAEDLVGYAAMRRVADEISEVRDRNLVNTTYWKSTPHFLNFSSGYRVEDRLKENAENPGLRKMLTATNPLNKDSLKHFDPIDLGNAKMRVLSQQTIERQWWKLLWMPPSLSYFKAAGAYRTADCDMTKRVVFSSWNSSPAAISSMLSYEAERHMVAGTDYSEYTAEARAKVTTHFQYRMHEGKPAAMPTLAMFWPLPGVADAADPRALTAGNEGNPLTRGQAMTIAERRVREHVALQQSEAEVTQPTSMSRPQLWNLAFALDSSWPAEAVNEKKLLEAFGSTDAVEDNSVTVDDGELPTRTNSQNVGEHIDNAARTRSVSIAMTDRLKRELTELALFSPANIAFRALGRLRTESTPSEAHFRAAIILANGLRSLFNRPDVTKMVEQTSTASTKTYRKKVLKYCADGNLEAVLDEYLHILAAEENSNDSEADRLVSMARSVAKALTIKGARLQALDLENLGESLTFVPRFALRYGRVTGNKEDARLPEIREAFNSPFWPFVLASTSVGQEGIDFHRWCHAIFHWNVPANPVDFEQREGRIDRYRGHAVRKNIARRHAKTALSHPIGNPWEHLYTLASEFRDEFGDFTPGWVYPGESKIESHVTPMVLSTDGAEIDRIKRDVALYRLTFGQPRQEDMLTVMRKNGISEDSAVVEEMRLDLRPPRRTQQTDDATQPARPITPLGR